MKRRKLMPLFLVLPLVISMLLIPLIALTPKESQKSETKADISKIEHIKLRRVALNKTVELSVDDYLVGVVACEMSAQFEKQALMAQAVAARTMLYRTIENGGTISDDSNTFQGYCDEGERKKKWNDKFGEYEQKIRSAVMSTNGEILTYNAQPILASYFALSAGKTESAKNVWGEDYPYLQAVESVGDMMADGFITKVSVSTADYISTAKSLGATNTDNPTPDSKPSMSESGTVLQYNLCGKSVTGKQMRTAFKLRSAVFTVEKTSDKFVFTVRGYGHGVGMSQNGANYMARQGSGYKEILLWYYKGCNIDKVN